MLQSRIARRTSCGIFRCLSCLSCTTPTGFGGCVARSGNEARIVIVRGNRARAVRGTWSVGDAADVRALRVVLLPEHRGGEGDDYNALAVLELIDRRRHTVARARNKSVEVVSRALEMFLERAAEEDLCAINLNQTVSDNLIYAL